MSTEELVTAQRRARKAGLDNVLDEQLLRQLEEEDDPEDGGLHDAYEQVRTDAGVVHAYVTISRADHWMEPAHEHRGTPLVAFLAEDWDRFYAQPFTTWLLLTARNNPHSPDARRSARDVGWSDAQIDDPNFYPGPEES